MSLLRRVRWGQPCHTLRIGGLPLLAGVFVTAVFMPGPPARAQRDLDPQVVRAIRALTELGATFSIDETGHALSVEMPEHVNDKMMALLCKVDTLEHVSLHSLTFSKASFLTLGRLPDLRSLDLSRSTISEIGMECLVEFRQLTRLSLAENRSVTDELVGEFISQMKNLERLDLSGTSITAECYSQIAKLEHLRELCLAKTMLGRDAQFADLAPLPKLESLALPGSYSGRIDVLSLSHLKTLQKLDLPAGSVALSTLVELKKQLPRLRVAGLSQFKGLVKLDDDGYVLCADGTAKDLQALHALGELPRLRRAEASFDPRIAQLDQLTELRLCLPRDGTIDLDDWDQLVALVNLESLEIGGQALRKENIDMLQRLKSLSKLDLSRTHTALDVVEAIEKKLPRVKVVHPRPQEIQLPPPR